MSKIIKAENLTYVKDKNKKTLNESRESKDADFSKEESELLYEETRKMIEEMINEAKEEAEKIIYEAKMKAEVIIEEKKEELDEIKNNTYAEAYEKGKNQAEEDNRDLKARADEILKMAIEERNLLIESSEKEITDFIIETIEQIILSKLNDTGEIAEVVSKNLLEYVKDSKDLIIIKGNPEDVKYMEANINSLKEVLTVGSLELKPDPSLNRGNILLLSNSGILEVDVEENLNKIKSALMEVNN